MSIAIEPAGLSETQRQIVELAREFARTRIEPFAAEWDRASKFPAEAVAESPEVPELFAHTYKTGEITGKLDESLNRLRALYQEEGTRKLRTLAQWSPKIVFLAVALMIACKVVSFYLGYFQRIADVIPK